MNRRAFLCGTISAALAVPFAVKAQQAGNVPTIGYVQQDDPTGALLREAFLEALHKRGWNDGQTVRFHWRRRDEDIPELVRLNMDVMVLPNPYRLAAGLKQTKKIPIVTIDLESDPVAKGFIRSLARPGGNVTGVWLDFPEIAGKQLQTLKETVPAVRRVAVVWDEQIAGPQFAATLTAARLVDVTVQSVVVRQEDEADAAIRQGLPARPQAILMLTSPVVLRSQRRIAELALQHQLPTFSGFSVFPDAGGLMAYGPDFVAMYQQMASYVDRILRGAKPGDLPIERPSKFELIINLKTARALGLTIPPSLLLRADRLIE